MPGPAARLAIAALVLLGAACGGPEPPAPIRLLVPPEGTRSTASIPRARIANESRFVLEAHPPVRVAGNVVVELPLEGPLRAGVELPEELARADEVYLEGRVTLRDSIVGRETRLDAPPLIHRRDADGPPVLRFAVPDPLRGSRAVLNVVGRGLDSTPENVTRTRAVEIPERGWLRFGYGVEEPGTREGWPPIRLRVFAESADGARSGPLLERRIDPAGDPRDRRWFDASIDLRGLSGRRRRFAFEARAISDAPGVRVARSLLVVSNPEITVAAPARPAEARRRDLVLISLDTLRARSVSAYGHARETTPSLDRRLAAAGARLENAIAPVPLTGPSHMSLFTGLDPCSHGVMGMQVLAPEWITLPEALRAAGYRTAAFTENGYLRDGAGFERGFDRYLENREPESGSTPGFARETFGAALDWLVRDAPRPSFVFIHTYQVHDPYAPPRGYETLFAGARRDAGGQGAVRGESWASLETAYDREIRYTDDVLADFLDALAARGRDERTVVVATSDHGEAFGEHGVGRHGVSLHDEALRVPLVIRAPGLIEPVTVVEEQVGLADLAPTLLDLLDVAPIENVQAQSFVRLLTGEGPRFEERPIVSSTFGLESVRTRRYKYIDYANRPALHDLEADPLERRNTAAGRPRLVEEAVTALERARAQCAAWAAAHPGTPARDTPRPATPDEKDTVDRLLSLGYVSEEVVEKLRSLGYVGD